RAEPGPGDVPRPSREPVLRPVLDPSLDRRPDRGAGEVRRRARGDRGGRPGAPRKLGPRIRPARHAADAAALRRSGPVRAVERVDLEGRKDDCLATPARYVEGGEKKGASAC